MCANGRYRCAADLAAAVDARTWVRLTVEAVYGSGGAQDDVELVASELISNGLNAGTRALTVDLDMHHDQVTLTVTDDAPGRPRLRTVDRTATRGRGLFIVGALSISWGVEVGVGPRTKAVWAVLPATAPRSFRCARGT